MKISPESYNPRIKMTGLEGLIFYLCKGEFAAYSTVKKQPLTQAAMFALLEKTKELNKMYYELAQIEKAQKS